MRDPTQRFSDRVEAYARYRPGYPRILLDILGARIGLSSSMVVADIGSGTGKLSELFLENGNRVIGVEPNPEMRRAGNELLHRYDRFESVEARAESTTLPDGSVDLITAGQAFHWFDAERARPEFRRILEPAGRVALIWNNRRIRSSPFMMDYEKILVTHGTDYTDVDRKNNDEEAVRSFFGENAYHSTTTLHSQELDAAGAEGRLSSCSYLPSRGSPACNRMLADFRAMLARHLSSGTVSFEYKTVMYVGRLGPA